jgi:hypothetical protein
MLSGCFRLCAVGAVMMASVPSSGCGKGDELDRQSVSGTVTLDGKPLPKGEIQFHPAAENLPVATGSSIVDGQFSIARDQGPTPGPYKVSISAVSGKPPELIGGMPSGAGTPNKELIPAKYNSQSTLTADVKTGGTNNFPFELSSK